MQFGDETRKVKLHRGALQFYKDDTEDKGVPKRQDLIVRDMNLEPTNVYRKNASGARGRSNERPLSTHHKPAPGSGDRAATDRPGARTRIDFLVVFITGF